MKKSIPLILSLALCISCVSPTLAEPNSVSVSKENTSSLLYKDAKYSITKEATKYKNGTVSFVSYEGSAKTFSIPDKIYIGELCYNVVSIDDFAFSKAQNTTSIKLPSSISYISDFAFASSPCLSEILCDNSSNFSSVDGILFSKDKTSLIAYPTTKKLDTYNIPTGTKTIKKGAFFENKYLKNVVAPSSLEIIEDYAFAKAISLNEVKDIINVKSIGGFAFANSNLSSISLSGKLKNLGESAFYSTNIKSITIPYSIVNIPKYCFYDCSYLRNVYLKDGVCTIGDYAFANSSIETIEFSKTLNTIGVRAFLNCDKINSLEFNDELSTIKDYAFENCDNLTEIIFNANLSTIGNSIFKDCKNIENINTSKNLYFIYENYILYSSDKTELIYISPNMNSNELILHKNISKIRNDALANISSVSEFVLDNKNENFKVEDGILYNSDKTKLLRYPPAKETANFILPETVTEIGSFAFKDATKLSGIMNISNISKIDKTAFKNNPDFSGFYINDNSNDKFSVVDNVLYNKDKTTLLKFPAQKYIKELTLPDSVRNIGSYAFEDTKVEKITSKNLITIEDNAFINSKLNSISMPKIEKIGIGAFRNSDLKSIELPKSLSIVEDYAFAECKNLSKVDIKPSYFKKLNDTAFYGDNNLDIIVPTDSYQYYNKILKLNK